MMINRRNALPLLASSPLLLRASFAAGRVLGSMPDPVWDLEQAFKKPPAATRPYVLWMWMGSNLSKRGITLDLEAMKVAGIGGATIYSLADTLTPWAGLIQKSPTPEIVTFTEPWWALVRHAAQESRRLGLELLLHNCAGYESSGGPWITPELSMQELIWSEKEIQGGQSVPLTLTRAKVDSHPHARFPTVYIPSLGRDGIPVIEARETYYRDVAVIALPSGGIPPVDQVIDLTDKMSASGELNWTAPEGKWTIFRFGHTTTGAMIQPAQWAAMGLECDKMSVEAVTFHCRHVLDDIKRHVGDLIGNPGLSTFYFDSYEAGDPTWTPKMRGEFRSRRGYDLVTYLPILAGRKIGSEDATAAFKTDFKRTVSDLYRDCYWATPRALAHEYGLEFVAEPYTGPWDTTEVVKDLDHANMEFWTNNGRYSPTANRSVIDTAHHVGQRIIGAEAFTTKPEWACWTASPAWLKPIGDAAFCDGVNRMNLHHFVQQPWGPEYQPGNAMGQWGVHFGRYQTWWEPGKAWLAYLWRCQTLLQTGHFIPRSLGTSAQLTPTQGAVTLMSVHRQRGTEHIFFLANTSESAGRADCSFPVTDQQIELWDPVRGTLCDLHEWEHTAGRTVTTLDFAPGQSWFVVFRRPVASRRTGRDFPTRTEVTQLHGPWDVQFDPRWGGPATIRFAELEDWSLRPEEGVRFYSGTAVYRKVMNLSAAEARRRLSLSLGTVRDIAKVTVNGRAVGVIWTAPWRIDISSAVKPGRNDVEIAVTNGWANRLIGDEQQPADVVWQKGDPVLKGGYFLRELPDWFLKNEPRPSQKRHTFTTWNYFHDRRALVSAGLLGPVAVLAED